MNRYQNRKPRYHTRLTYGIVINPKAGGYSKDKIDYLIENIAKAHANWHIIESETTREITFQIRKLLARKPFGIIACGGDSTVNLVGRNLIRRTSSLGIFPMGRFNNIYKSLYGEPDTQIAVNHILSRQNRKIDYGQASGQFFLGSIGIGLIPSLLQLINQKRIPRFGFGWSRLTTQAASAVTATQMSITMDEFRYEISPLIVNLNLLPYSIGLPLTPSSINDDGSAEVIFDNGRGQAVLSKFIRHIFKQKYIYSDEVKIYRGRKISISSVAGRDLYLDGEILELSADTLDIEIFPSKIRILQEKSG